MAFRLLGRSEIFSTLRNVPRATTPANPESDFRQRMASNLKRVSAIVAEQSRRQRNGALPVSSGAYGSGLRRSRSAPRLVTAQIPKMTEVLVQRRSPPAKPAQASDQGPDLVQRWIARVDREWVLRSGR